mgnify:FL=1
MKKQIWILLTVLALVSMACTINLPVNVSGGGVGETKTFEIDEQWVSDEGSSLKLEMGAGELNMSSGGDSLVKGSIEYNIENWEPEILREGENLTIRQIIDTIDLTPNNETINHWNLQIGTQPLELTIAAGAYSGEFNFDEIALTKLVVTDGASDVDVKFNALNSVRMEEFSYTTGASDLKITGLANANVAHFKFTGGAGSATLDFSGDLQEDMDVVIEGGAGDINIIVPEGTACVLRNTGTLVDVDNNGWDRDGETYSLSGSGPVITITSNLSVGSLELNVD